MLVNLVGLAGYLYKENKKMLTEQTLQNKNITAAREKSRRKIKQEKIRTFIEKEKI